MKTRSRLLPLLGLLVPAAAAAQGDALRQEIERMNQAMVAAWQRNDAKGVAAFYSDDARIVMGRGGRPLSGRAAIDNYWTSMDMRTHAWKLDVPGAGGNADVAYQFGRSTLGSAERAQVVDFIGIWKRQPNGELR